ncbi:KRAB [Lepeophtheirus salmonis]|uniref:KRAB n=1 Tax=Lepeophtheirus salmonis TaxID=72036 RepID=A0A7R8CQ93_LEPSM|nr:KRAB [Lepeophtheirus salmonis]CAF2893224.1 KRAB [Lepeophtheirus salmonis]
MSYCGVCSWKLRPGESSYSLSGDRTSLSNVSLLFKLFDLLGLELSYDGLICHSCYELIEEIDFFEHNVGRSKDKLRSRLPLFKCPQDYLAEMSEFESTICHLCESSSFPSWRDKISHYLKSHSTQLPFVCPIDNESLPDPFDSHFIHDHGLEDWTSEFSIFKLLGETKTSLQPNHKQCSKCGLICTSEMAFLFHSRFHHQVDPEPFDKCLFCPNISSNFKDLITHVLKNHCGIIFSSNSVNCDTSDLEQCLDTPDKFLCDILEIKNEENVFNENDHLSQTKIKEILKEHLESLTQIPNEINNDSEGDAWDINKLKWIIDDPRTEENIQVIGERKCFSCKLEFETHMKKICHRSQIHSPIKGPTFQCHFCLESFSLESKATKHINEEHGFSTHHPWYLSQQQSQGLISNSEGKISLGNGGYQCCICSLNCSSLTNFLIHKISSHSSNAQEYECDYCFEKYLSKSNLRLHVLIGHGSYKYQCPVCSLTFDKSIEFCEHIKSEHIMIRRESSSKFEFQIKSSSYEKKDALTCHLCHHNGSGTSTYHNRSVHTKSAPCQFCGKLFEKSPDPRCSYCKPFMKGKTLIKEFMCENCSRTFSSKQLLQTHMRCHSNDKKITCKICGKAFKWESSLVSHTRAAHSSMTLSVQYDCNFCGKSFKDRSNLKKIMYILILGRSPINVIIVEKGLSAKI